MVAMTKKKLSSCEYSHSRHTALVTNGHHNTLAYICYTLPMQYFWSSSQEPTFHDMVHYTLAYGTYADCISIVKEHSLDAVRSEFLKPKKGLYSRQAFGFARLLLHVTPNAKDYVKTISWQGSHDREKTSSCKVDSIFFTIHSVRWDGTCAPMGLRRQFLSLESQKPSPSIFHNLRSGIWLQFPLL